MIQFNIICMQVFVVVDFCPGSVYVAGQMCFQAKRVWPRPDAFSLFSKTHGCISN